VNIGNNFKWNRVVENLLLAHSEIKYISTDEGNQISRSQMLNTIKEGRIVPSEVTVRLIQQEMESSDSNKFLIDGFPRTEENRIAFEQLVSFLSFFHNFHERCSFSSWCLHWYSKDLVSFPINLIMISSYVKAHQVE
jgi:adenylate kinase family enzyme